MRITSKGQVTIPQEIRERAGLLPNTEVEFIYDGKTVRLVKADRGKSEFVGLGWSPICAAAAAEL